METKTIEKEVTFRATPSAVFEALMDSKKHSEFTGAPAEIQNRVGGTFSAYGGHCGGITIDLKQNSRIVQAWRCADWAEGHYSFLTYTLEPVDGNKTRLSLAQAGVPAADYGEVDTGWKEHYFAKMTAFFAR